VACDESNTSTCYMDEKDQVTPKPIPHTFFGLSVSAECSSLCWWYRSNSERPKRMARIVCYLQHIFKCFKCQAQRVKDRSNLTQQSPTTGLATAVYRTEYTMAWSHSRCNRSVPRLPTVLFQSSAPRPLRRTIRVILIPTWTPCNNAGPRYEAKFWL
jgi:hypothetical protein